MFLRHTIGNVLCEYAGNAKLWVRAPFRAEKLAPAAKLDRLQVPSGIPSEYPLAWIEDTPPTLLQVVAAPPSCWRWPVSFARRSKP